ncbi:hypothetical protein LC653_39380 [Nostoc sp. CHAB 5784]|nr:hypothetical protein [Nostoc mirabile CHAB5784]
MSQHAGYCQKIPSRKKARCTFVWMKLKPKITIADHFAQMSDPRIDRTKRDDLVHLAHRLNFDLR